ncbi:hypothetical protein LCGC14_0372860 [marine sediment metagenome]|uniref:Uncharacterized protein n=1 Tax=marine sediment metagenome TaxID=412755 RepID=A0A0F9T519_9ZZZZ
MAICPRCNDDVQDAAYAIHVNQTCCAIGLSEQDAKMLREANEEEFSVVATLAERQADLAPEEEGC